jgi:hypothetical protein
VRIRIVAAAIAVAAALSGLSVPAPSRDGDLLVETPADPARAMPRDEPCDGGWSGNWLRCPGRGV